MLIWFPVYDIISWKLRHGSYLLEDRNIKSGEQTLQCPHLKLGAQVQVPALLTTVSNQSSCREAAAEGSRTWCLSLTWQMWVKYLAPAFSLVQLWAVGIWVMNQQTEHLNLFFPQSWSFKKFKNLFQCEI